MNERERELYEGYLALRHNPCWLYLAAETSRRRGYLAQRILQAASWEEFCSLAGQLKALDSVLGQVDSVRALPGREEEEAKGDL